MAGEKGKQKAKGGMPGKKVGDVQTVWQGLDAGVGLCD